MVLGYRHLRGRNKESQKVVTAIGRELLGFIWAIGVQIEHESQEHRQEQASHRYRIRRTKAA